MEIKNNNKSSLFSEALTFDDVLLVPAFSEVLPRNVDISTQLTREIRLNVPIVSAAMDTVTEKELAIAIAREGGIGMVHKNMSIETQADQVRSVKRSESGMIKDPVTLTVDAKVGDARAVMAKYKIGGIPIINKDEKLIGILTNRDLRFEPDVNRSVSELMTRENLVTVPVGTTLDQAKEMLQQYKIEKLPVVDDSYRLKGLITYKDLMKLEDYPNSCKDESGRLIVGAAVGVSGDMHDRIDALVNVDVDVVCVDTAHGHSQGVLEAISEIKRRHPELQLIGGNVATGEGARALAKAGVDGIKVGVGPGSICTTRVVAGVGVPQLSAIYHAAEEAKKSGIPIIGDGGIRYTGDIAKAIVAGASCIMAGSSLNAMAMGSKDRYFQDVEDDVKKLVPEGIEGRVPFKGSVAEVMVQYIGGLRAGMGYCGAKDIPDLMQASFVKITNAGILESHPHHVVITKEAPNYSRR
jgi:IMP dehydrogenase